MIEKTPLRLIQALLAQPAETEWLEFKASYARPQDVGEYISALSNSATLHVRTSPKSGPDKVDFLERATEIERKACNEKVKIHRRTNYLGT